MTRRQSIARALLGLLVLSAGCGGGGGLYNIGGGGKKKGTMRIVHCSPAAPNVNVVFNKDIVWKDLPYGESTDYLGINAGEPIVKIYTLDGSEPIIEENVDISKKQNYSLFLVNPVDAIATLVTEDDDSKPERGRVRVRFVHAAPGLGAVDIYVTAPGASIAGIPPTLAGVPYLGVSAYLDAAEGTYEVRITPAGTKAVAIDTGAVELPSQSVSTGVAIGDPDAGAPLGALLLDDRN